MRRFCILFIFLLSISSLSFSEAEIESTTAKAKIIKITSNTTEVEWDEISTDSSYRVQTAQIKILDGEFKGREFVIDHIIPGDFSQDIILEDGDNVILSIEDNGINEPNLYVTGFVRDKHLLRLAALFMLLLILIGGLKGFKSVVTLMITGVLIAKVMLPLILKGFNPLIITTLCAMFISLMTFFIIGGINSKSISALIGTTGGVVVAGLLAYTIGPIVKITGLSSEEASMLMNVPQNTSFDFRNLLFSGIIIGTLGAVMDVAMSISSSMYQLKELSPGISYKSFVRSGLNIGKDIMGTMSNALILAYTGSSVPLLLVFMSHNTPISEILNLDFIATEIVRALVGSIGLIVAIPITALTAGFILKSNKLINKKIL